MTLGKTSARYGERVPTPHYGQPRYRLIAEALRRRIESGAIPPGALLPAESALVAEFQVSRGTIRQAIAALRELGVANTEHGRGTYAMANAQPLAQHCASATHQREIPADTELAALLGVAAGTILIEQESVMHQNGGARTVVRSYRLPETAEGIQH
ncbi:hypothetical protein GCM10028790_25010 [Micromonospora taraxaci]